MPSILSNPLAWIAMAVLAFFAITFLPGFIAAVLEKRMIWPYQAAAEFRERQPTAAQGDANPYAAPAAQDAVPITSYANATCRELEATGFRYLGAFYDIRRGIYKLRYDFWVSSDDLILALVGGGTLAAIPVSGTSLFTRLEDGASLVTIDEPKSRDSDPSGRTLQEVVTHADLDTLIARHRQRGTESERPTLGYTARAALKEHRAFRTQRVEFLIDHGLARYLDQDRNIWRYTLKGALKAISSTWLSELTRQLKEPGRDRVARQGERGYVPTNARNSRVVRIIGTIQNVCWMAMFLGVVLSSTNGPPRNRAQLAFRIAVPTIALGALVTLQIVKWIIKSQAKSASGSTGVPADSGHDRAVSR